MADITAGSPFAELDYSEISELQSRLSHAGSRFFEVTTTLRAVALRRTRPLSAENEILWDQAAPFRACMDEMHALAEDLDPVVHAALDRYLARTGA